MTFVKTRQFPLGLILCALVFLLASCEEIPPTLNLVAEGGGPVTSELADQPKGVLIEEFTGVRCVNCPAGAEAIAQFKVLYGKQLVPVALHTGFFARPYAENRVDFRTADADAIEVYLGEPQGYPSAVIDRLVYEGETGLQVTRNSWAGYIGARLAEEPRIALGLTTAYDTLSRQLTVDVEMLGRLGTDGREAFLTVLLLENDIVDYQLTPEGKQADYVHEHALREAITPPLGESIGAFAASQLDTMSYSVSVSPDYNAEHLELAAYVHYADLDEGGREVLQAVSVAVE